MRDSAMKAGFSLIEVMIVMVLIAIVGIFAAPEIMNYRPNMQLNSASRELFGCLQNAKMAAVRDNQNAVVAFSRTVDLDGAGPEPAQAFSYLSFIDDDKDFVFDVGERVLMTKSLDDYKYVDFDTAEAGGDGVSFVDGGGSAAVAFRANGFPTDSGGGFAQGTVHFITTTGKKMRVVMSNAGNLKIESD